MFGGLFKVKKGEMPEIGIPDAPPFASAAAEEIAAVPDLIVPENAGPVEPRPLTLDAGEDPDEEPAGTPASVFDFSPPAPPAAGAAEETGEEDGSLADLFSGSGSDGEENTSLGILLDLAPNASIDDLMEDLMEIKELLRGRLAEQQNWDDF